MPKDNKPGISPSSLITNPIGTLSLMYSNPSVREYLNSTLIIAATKALMTPVTQPLQVVMRNQQAALDPKRGGKALNSMQSAHSIFWDSFANRDVRLIRVTREEKTATPLRSADGMTSRYSPHTSILEINHFEKKPGLRDFLAFWKGTVSATNKEFFKNAVYKAYFITQAPHIANFLLESGTPAKDNLSSNQYHWLKSILAGGIAGTAETFFGNPFDAVSNFRATSHGEHAKADLWDGKKGLVAKTKRLYRGADATFVKSAFGFTAYFTGAKYAKAQVAAAYGASNFNELPAHGKFLSVFSAGLIVALASAPWEIIKAQKQMASKSTEAASNPGRISLGQALKRNYSSHGARGLTAGLPLKMMMIIMGWSAYDGAIQLTNHFSIFGDKTKDAPEELSATPANPKI